MRILLVGASGMLGSAVGAALTARGHDVVPASRQHGVSVDITDPGSIEVL
ncbi:NAD-dependent epimerase/dehydratase family protein [Streptomyces ardesiacus]